MKLALVLLVAGIALVAFGIMFTASGGACTTACLPRLNMVAYNLGWILLAAGVVRAAWGPARRFPTGADRSMRLLVAGAISLLAIGFYIWARTPQPPA
ncbi:MAG: hypothetical protein QOH59_805 [Gemmatimonadales bacterium]|jgi:hypothetical protein|nr:hypothetical protein [Gemmatimonadales bacterium]